MSVSSDGHSWTLEELDELIADAELSLRQADAAEAASLARLETAAGLARKTAEAIRVDVAAKIIRYRALRESVETVGIE